MTLNRPFITTLIKGLNKEMSGFNPLAPTIQALDSATSSDVDLVELPAFLCRQHRRAAGADVDVQLTLPPSVQLIAGRSTGQRSIDRPAVRTRSGAVVQALRQRLDVDGVQHAAGEVRSVHRPSRRQRYMLSRCNISVIFVKLVVRR